MYKIKSSVRNIKTDNKKRLKPIIFWAAVFIATILLTDCSETPSTPTPPSPEEDIANAIQVSKVTPNSLKLTNTSGNTVLKIVRRLIDEKEEVGTLGPQSTYVDTVKWDGTQYYYWGERIDNSSKKSNEVGIITDIADTTKKRGLFYKWSEIAKSNGVSDRILNIDPSSTVYNYMIHGVDVKVVYEKPVADAFTENQLKGYFLKAVQMFHRNWQFFEGFPLNEIRVICWDEDYTESGYEGILGSQFLKSYLIQSIDNTIIGYGEAQSHGMGHAWVASPVLVFPNGWMWEGFDCYNGIVTLDHRMDFFKENLANPDFIKLKLEPLDTIYNKYFSTPYARGYYIKGSLFAYLVSRRLINYTNRHWSGFMKYLYDRYYLSQNKQGQKTPRDGLVIDLKKALNSYSGLDFTDMFEDFVYGNEDITTSLQIENKYLPVFYSPSGKQITQD